MQSAEFENKSPNKKQKVAAPSTAIERLCAAHPGVPAEVATVLYNETTMPVDLIGFIVSFVPSVRVVNEGKGVEIPLPKDLALSLSPESVVGDVVIQCQSDTGTVEMYRLPTFEKLATVKSDLSRAPDLAYFIDPVHGPLVVAKDIHNAVNVYQATGKLLNHFVSARYEHPSGYVWRYHDGVLHIISLDEKIHFRHEVAEAPMFVWNFHNVTIVESNNRVTRLDRETNSEIYTETKYPVVGASEDYIVLSTEYFSVLDATTLRERMRIPRSWPFQHGIMLGHYHFLAPTAVADDDDSITYDLYNLHSGLVKKNIDLNGMRVDFNLQLTTTGYAIFPGMIKHGEFIDPQIVRLFDVDE